MISIVRNVALLALVQVFAACAGGLVREEGRTNNAVTGATTRASMSRETAHEEAPAVAHEKEKMLIMEVMTFNVYRRGGRFSVTAFMSGPGVKWIEIPDIIPVEPEVESLAAAFRHLEPPIRKALVEAQNGERQPIDEKHWERMQAKSWKEFVRSTSFCAVDRFPDHVDIWYMVADGKGNLFRSIDAEPNAKLPPDASHDKIATSVLEIFAKYPPPPGDKPALPKSRRKAAGTER